MKCYDLFQMYSASTTIQKYIKGGAVLPVYSNSSFLIYFVKRLYDKVLFVCTNGFMKGTKVLIIGAICTYLRRVEKHNYDESDFSLCCPLYTHRNSININITHVVLGFFKTMYLTILPPCSKIWQTNVAVSRVGVRVQ